MDKVIDIAILGAGESGVGAALLAKSKGQKAFVSDGGSMKGSYRAILEREGIDFEEGGHTMEKLLQADLVVKSPGIPDTVPVIKTLHQEGKEIISEIEYGYRHTDATIIAITGSNGKTTTSLLTYDILQKSGADVTLAGNIGKSFAAALSEGESEYYVLEVSSFQLDGTSQFRPHIAIITNITPDHLDRYDNDMSKYVASKFKITENQQQTDFLIYNMDDDESRKKLEKINPRATAMALSIEEEVANGAWATPDNHITINIKNQEPMSINELALQGKHNVYNSMAAGLANKLLGIRKETIRESLAGFDNVEHRLESVLQIYGIQFINDSKATNVNSTWYALESMQGPTIWIAGGVDKGNDYSQLHDLVSTKVKAIVCLGEDNTKLHSEFEDKVPFMIDAASMDEAVRIAYKLGDKGDSVLLSPACASFDLFDNFEDRGRQFKNAVRNL